MIYLDNASTTQPSFEVKNKIIEIFDIFGNPSSLHKLGMSAENEINVSRESISKIIGCQVNELYFTSSGTESNNLAILGTTPSKVITSQLEHPSVIETAKQIENHVLLDNIDQLEDELNPKERRIIVSLMQVNSETGAINDIKKAREIIDESRCKAFLHVDCVQGFCKLESVWQYADMISISSHKIHGLKGIGALVARKSVPLKPIVHGGGQERKMRSGTENVLGIAAFGLAAKLAESNRITNYEKIKELNQYMRNNIKNAYIISPENASPYILNVAFEGIMSEVLLHALELREVYISTGSACSKGAKSNVLSALKLPDNYIKGAIRISFSSNNNFEEIKTATKIINEEVEKLL